jgi:peptidyl-prolyl cis-trans isomerase D
LILEEAGKLAKKDGEENLARLTKGDDVKLSWGVVRSVLRAAPTGIAPDAARAVFKADISKLPAYTGAALPDGSYMLYRIQNVKAAAESDPRGGQLAQQYARLVAEEDFGAWLEGLRQRYPVKVNTKALERKE